MDIVEKAIINMIIYCMSCFFYSVLVKPYSIFFLPLIMVSAKNLFLFFIGNLDDEITE